MTKNIKVGVIGLGAIGERLIRNFSEHSSTKVVAICDTLQERVKAMEEKLPGTISYINHQQMLNEQELDLVYVAVPPKFHHQIVLDVIEKGIHILCEKPLANSNDEAKEIMERATEKGIVQAMNFPMNYSPGANTFEKLIKDGYIGELRRLELKMHFPQWPRVWQQNDWVASREQGGFVLEVGVHYIQLTQRIFGEIRPQNSKLELPVDPTKSEIGILANLELENGTPFIIDGLSQVAGDEVISYTAYGTEGTLSLLNWSALEGGKIGAKIQPIEATEDSSSLLANLVHAIQNGEGAKLYDFTAGYNAQVVLESLRQG